jgi:hypothetical protein
MNNQRDAQDHPICPRCDEPLTATQPQMLARFVSENVSVHMACCSPAEIAAYQQWHEKEYNQRDLDAWRRDARP